MYVCSKIPVFRRLNERATDVEKFRLGHPRKHEGPVEKKFNQ